LISMFRPVPRLVTHPPPIGAVDPAPPMPE
jgi:hypothetical protein